MELSDGETVETVWMPEGDGGEIGDGSEAGDEIEGGASPAAFRRATICVSSQVGCAVNCRFCFTALLGVKRNLEAGELWDRLRPYCAIREWSRRGSGSISYSWAWANLF